MMQHQIHVLSKGMNQIYPNFNNKKKNAPKTDPTYLHKTEPTVTPCSDPGIYTNYRTCLKVI